MSYATAITKSLFGRQLGLQLMSTSVTGGSRGPFDALVGAECVREGVSTGESTGTNLTAYGVSRVLGTSVASTPVFTLDPPVPGVRKTIDFASTDSALYVKMASGCAISGTSLATTGATVIRSSGGGTAELIGLTTALFKTLCVSSTAVNGMGFQATT
jgi:hypothetical protein